MTVIAIGVTLFFYVTSPRFDEQARQYIVKEIETRTGAKTSLETFKWDLWQRRFRLENLTLRGLEAPDEKPLAHFDRIDIGLNFRTLLERHIDLFELTLTRPEFHVLVGRDGKTNLPSPVTVGKGPSNFQISIANFNILGGSALLNERQVQLDFSLANIAALLQYHGAGKVMEAHFRYDGVLTRDTGTPIPYTLSADMDYTSATLIAQRMNVKSAGSELKLQGKVSSVLSSDISGKLEYAGNVEVAFLNHFFTKERFAGKADVAGSLDFTRGYFSTRGNAAARTVDFEGWHATTLTGDYTYEYPDRRLSFEKMNTQVVGGSVSGGVVVEHLPGAARVLVDIDYSGVDAAALARVYPWDHKYRIFSKMTGTLNGWFEGKLERYDLSGHADLKAYEPGGAASLVPLPLNGSADYEVRPGQAELDNGHGRFYSTDVTAQGLVHKTASDLKLTMTSSDLKDLAFLYPDANGLGSFDGVLSGPISKPVLTGEFTLQNHRYREWTIEKATGGVRLDMKTEVAMFRDTWITQGRSGVLVNGTTALSGTPADLWVQADHVTGNDIRPFVNRNISGTFSGNIHVTSISPIEVDGDMHVLDLAVDDGTVGDVTGDVRYFDPVIELNNLSIRNNRATVAGSLVLNRSTQELKFAAHANNVDLMNFRDVGLPESISGFIQQADVHGEGTTSRPNVSGGAVLQTLSVYGESFPLAQVSLSSSGSTLDVTLDAGRDVTLKAEIDTAVAGYPFSSAATFTSYPLEGIGGLKATFVVTGDANLSGLLTDRKSLNGRGHIQSADVQIREIPLRTTKAFTFDFNSDRLMFSGVTLTGESMQVNLVGTVGLNERAPLNLDVTGRMDLGFVTSSYPEWTSTGAVNVDGRISGTLRNPDLRGFAHINAASFSHRGIFTSLSNVNGDVFFDQNRMTVNNVTGTMGGGTVHAQGTALVQNGTVEAMNIRIETDRVRVRYPEGLRTVLNATLVLRGALDSPVLEGNVQIQSLAYRSDFEDFLALIAERRGAGEPSPLARVQLALRVQGGRNITIQNQLANVEARVDINVEGSVDNPSVTGHIEASGGTLLFQGNRYTLTRGNIDFVDPQRIQPVVDVQAESQVRDYRVILSVTGPGDKLRLDMRSDPPLPELEIVSLIAGGQTREELAAKPGTAGVPTSEQLFQRGAASILFDLLQQRVGNRLGLFGISRVRVEPFLVGAQSTPGARITLAEQVTKDLSITYSQDLSSKGQQIILIEYFVSRNTSIVASRDELGNLGLDVRRRTRF